jgi:serine/threonine-protein kinase
MGEDLAPPVKEGDVLAGRYRVERVLAVGGMGVVVAARHVQLGQKVALKFLLGAVPSSSDAATRFDREAKAAALLRSEHVARVIDVGKLDNEAPYLVMEFLEGRDLQQLIEEHGPLPTEEAVEYVLQALEGLGEAHVAGIIHRDLKPGNLFRTQRPDGSPVIKVLDFGISKVEDAAGHGMTSTTTVLGSPIYMSPEQMESAKRADQRSDIWSMGVVIHQLLTGDVPFNADTLAGLCVAIATKEPRRLRDRRTDLPVDLEQVVLRCLAKKPDDRYANVAELATALVPFAAPGAHQHAERLRRLFGKPPGAPVSHPSRISLGDIQTLDALGRTETALTGSLRDIKKPRSALWPIGALMGALAIAAATWALWPRTHPPAPAVAPVSANASSVAATPTATPTASATMSSGLETPTIAVGALPSASQKSGTSPRPALNPKPTASMATSATAATSTTAPPPTDTNVHAAPSSETQSTRK